MTSLTFEDLSILGRKFSKPSLNARYLLSLSPGWCTTTLEDISMTTAVEDISMATARSSVFRKTDSDSASLIIPHQRVFQFNAFLSATIQHSTPSNFILFLCHPTPTTSTRVV